MAKTTFPLCSRNVLSALSSGISISVIISTTSIFLIGTLTSSLSIASLSALFSSCFFLMAHYTCWNNLFILCIICHFFQISCTTIMLLRLHFCFSIAIAFNIVMIIILISLWLLTSSEFFFELGFVLIIIINFSTLAPSSEVLGETINSQFWDNEITLYFISW